MGVQGKQRILITGASGQVGWELNRSLLPFGALVALDQQDADLADPAQLRARVREVQPQVIVNAAAYTAVDRAEEERELAMRVNGEAPGVLAEEARRLGALLVHYSTDYVFDGRKPTPYREDDTTAPLNVYGESKLAGEQAVAAGGADYLLLRTSWVYAARGSNFLLTMQRLLQERDQLGIVDDQLGSPTCARLIADTTALTLQQALRERAAGAFESGLYHLTASGETSWYGFAREILTNLQRLCPEEGVSCRVEPITSEQYPTPATRPKNSRLSCDALAQHFGLTMPSWQELLVRTQEELVGCSWR